MNSWLFKITFLISVVMPWSNALTSLLLIPFGFLYFSDLYKNGLNKTNWFQILVIGCIFIVNFIFGLINNDILENLKISLGQAPLLILPIFVLSSSQGFSSSQILKLLLGFSLSVLLMASINYIGAFLVLFSKNGDSINAFNTIRYEQFSRGFINHHQLYFGMYLSFTVVVCFYFLINFSKKIRKYFLVIALVLALYFLVILSVRMSLASTALGIFIVVLTSKITKLSKLTIIVGLFATLFFAYNTNSTLKKRIDYLKEFSFDYNYQEDWAYEGLALRFMNWECSLNVALDNISSGVGLANVQKELNACYKENEFESILYFTRTHGSPFNSHNFYLQTFVASGIIGFVVCIGMIILLLFGAIKNKNKLLFIFLILFFIQGITESLLYREKGIYFFALFCSILIGKEYNKNHDLEIKKS